MISSFRLIVALVKDRRAVTAVEYAVVAAGLIAVAATAFSQLGGRLTNMINALLT
jgi:Flp pilus assembly pilin Flp